MLKSGKSLAQPRQGSAGEAAPPGPRAAERAERLADSRRALERFVDDCNAELRRRPGSPSVRPFFLAPEACWRGPAAELLGDALALSPYEDWNFLLLASDAESAEALDVRPHPGEASDAYVEMVERLILSLHADAVRDFGLEHEAPTGPARLRYGEMAEALRSDLRALAAHLGEEMLGAQTLSSCQGLFFTAPRPASQA